MPTLFCITYIPCTAVGYGTALRRPVFMGITHSGLPLTFGLGELLIGFRCTSPSQCFNLIFGPVAQLGERRVRNAEAKGSIPSRSTKS